MEIKIVPCNIFQRHETLKFHRQKNVAFHTTKEKKRAPTRPTYATCISSAHARITGVEVRLCESVYVYVHYSILLSRITRIHAEEHKIFFLLIYDGVAQHMRLYIYIHTENLFHCT